MIVATDGPTRATAAPDGRGKSAGSIAVAARASDPLARAGAVALLETEPGLEVTLSDRAADPTAEAPATPAVTVLVAGRLDETIAVELRRCVRQPGREVVLVADALREPELMVALECGVRTILRRDEVTRAELVAAVRTAARRESRLPPDLLGQLMAHVGRVHRASGLDAEGLPPVGLSRREIEVLELLAEGLETKDVAEKLAWSERTIKNVLYGLTSRLQLRNRTHAVAYAFREGYL